MTRFILFGLALLVGCGGGDSASPRADSSSGGGLSGVGQGGAQDFGLFRQILDDGGIPGPETLDDVGFFNEHVVELPLPDCGEDVCLHGLYGTMGNMISGSDCTVLLLGMNSTVTADTLERPPLHLTVVVDTSGSMRGDPIAAVKRGLTGMLEQLEEGDRLTLVSFGGEAELMVEGLTADDPLLAQAIDDLTATGSTNLYDGLRRGYESAEAWADPAYQNRLMLLSDGMASTGITSFERIVELSAGYSEAGFSLSTIGLGSDFDVELMRDLSEQGGGAFYFVEDVQAVDEVFQEEVNVFLVPIAERAEISVAPNSPWNLRGVYGTRLFGIEEGVASIDIATLQLAGRTTPSDGEGGRRGGGGAMLLELLPSGEGDMVGPVGELDFSYRVPFTDTVVEQSVEVVAPAEALGGTWFTDSSVEKGFVMLNLYVGFRMAADSASRGDDPGALAVLYALDGNVRDWLQQTPDADIADDLVYVERFIENVEARAGQVNRPEAQEPWPVD
ncbi:MAG: VWA domain-containing protein [Myxococcales bacterium]|nr:VWA domain-containing protein [Myxococcales bacterium]